MQVDLTLPYKVTLRQGRAATTSAWASKPAAIEFHAPAEDAVSAVAAWCQVPSATGKLKKSDLLRVGTTFIEQMTASQSLHFLVTYRGKLYGSVHFRDETGQAPLTAEGMASLIDGAIARNDIRACVVDAMGKALPFWVTHLNALRNRAESRLPIDEAIILGDTFDELAFELRRAAASFVVVEGVLFHELSEPSLILCRYGKKWWAEIGHYAPGDEAGRAVPFSLAEYRDVEQIIADKGSELDRLGGFQVFLPEALAAASSDTVVLNWVAYLIAKGDVILPVISHETSAHWYRLRDTWKPRRKKWSVDEIDQLSETAFQLIEAGRREGLDDPEIVDIADVYRDRWVLRPL
jgi:hypothetical protein